MAILDNDKIKVSKTQKSSKAFLVDLGVITEKGNLRENDKNLCIPVEEVSFMVFMDVIDRLHKKSKLY